MINLQPLPTPEKSSTVLQATIFALVRQVLTIGGTVLVAKGYLEASEVEPIVGIILTLTSVVWSIIDKRNR